MQTLTIDARHIVHHPAPLNPDMLRAWLANDDSQHVAPSLRAEMNAVYVEYLEAGSVDAAVARADELDAALDVTLAPLRHLPCVEANGIARLDAGLRAVRGGGLDI